MKLFCHEKRFVIPILGAPSHELMRLPGVRKSTSLLNPETAVDCFDAPKSPMNPEYPL
jgi:hypothetical protein